MRRNLFTHITNAALLVLILWVLLLCTPFPPLSDGTCLLASAILCGVGLVLSVAAIFLPGVPRLKREKGRSQPSPLLWTPLLLLLMGGTWLALEGDALTAGRPPRMDDDLRHSAAMGMVLTAMGACLTVAAARMHICWNDEGFTLRTALGRIRSFGYEQLTGYSTHRGTTYLHVDQKRYVLSVNAEEAAGFWRCVNDRRRELGLGWVSPQPPML